MALRGSFPGGPSERPKAPPVPIGELLAGKYRVDGVLATGGMGTVIAVTHVHLQQRFAVKLMFAEQAGDELLVKRFEREARAAAQLRTEHVARVVDVGRLDNGSPYMVMELLEGSDLSEVLRTRGPLPIEEAVGYVIQACEAVAEAHAIGIIHRDLKPSNLYVTRRVNGTPLVKVLDFGISKWQRGNTLTPRLTATTAIIGSPLYMSPEQMREAHAVDRRSDIWALGVVLYELLVGRTPFDAEHVSEVAAKVLRDPPMRPRVARADLPHALEDVILRCLAKDPDARYATVAELVRALSPYRGDRAFDAFDTPSGVATRGIGFAATIAVPVTAPSATTHSDVVGPAPIGSRSVAEVNAYLMAGRPGDAPRSIVPMRSLLVVVVGAAILAAIVAMAYPKPPPPPREQVDIQAQREEMLRRQNDDLLRRAQQRAREMAH